VASQQFHRRRYPRIADRFHLVRNFVDPDVHYAVSDEARETARRSKAAELGLPPNTRFLLFAGRLERMKDPLTLLRAFAVVARPDVHLLMAGEGRLRAEIERAASDLGIATRVSLLGALGAHELAGLQRLSSALVLTSAYEGLPLVVLETLACGTPVVTTPSGDSPRVVTSSTGQVSGAFTPESVAAALSSVLDRPEGYARTACIDAARPFNARTVVTDVCAGMLDRWTRGQTHH
jgi:glycosyltransferase involved in cell wall biosynthesis